MKLPAAPSMAAIPTTYNGITFKSRLESRWARFLDLLTIEWRYEPEGYEWDGVRYLPDFWLPKGEMFLEVKPFEDVFPKQMALATGTGKIVLVAVGDVQDRTVIRMQPLVDGIARTRHTLCWCPSCRLLYFNEPEWTRRFCPECGTEIDATEIARKAQNEQFWIPPAKPAISLVPDPFDDEPLYVAGMRVFHETFGEGQVVDVIPYGKTDANVQVIFANGHGVKWLRASIVKDKMVAA